MQIKISGRQNYTPMRMAKIKQKIKDASVDENVELLRLSFVAGRSAKWYSQLGKVWQFRIKLNIYLACELAISLLGIYPSEFFKNFCLYKNLLLNVYMSFFIITPNGSISSSDTQINCLWYTRARSTSQPREGTHY